MFKKTLNNTSFYIRKAPEGESGGEGGGAGGTSAGNAGAESPPSSAPVGGVQQAAFDHGPSGEQFSPPDVNARVGEIMKQPGDTRLTAQQLADMLAFNVPFVQEKKEEPKAGAETTPPAGTSPPAPAATTTTPPAETTPPAAAAPTPLTPEAIAAAVAAAIKPAEAKPEGTKAPEAPKPFYGAREQGAMRDAIQVNPEIKAAIFGDKPEVAAAAIDVMVNGIMNQLMADSGQMMAMMYQKIVQDVRSVIPQQITHQTESRNNTERFYSKYQELNVPTIKPLIEAVAAAMRKAEPNANPGSDDFLNRLGLGVHAAFKKEFGFDLPRKGAAVAPAPNAPQRKEPFVTNGGARPPAAANGHDKSADILGLLI